MSAHKKQTYSDWMFGGLIVLLCVGLTVLQYRWTGEIANAELIRLRGNLEEQSRALARAFDAELSESCDQILPPREDFANQTQEATILARFKSWKATNPRPIFSRIALAVPMQSEIQLSLLDQNSGKFIRTNWPAEWSTLRENLADILSGDSPPFSDGDGRGVLLEFPIGRDARQRGGPPDADDFPDFRAGPPRHGPPHFTGERWLIAELDLAYAHDIWLPQLVAEYLNPGGRAFNEARVQTIGNGSRLLYASQTNAMSIGNALVSVRFNTEGRSENHSHGLPQSGRWLLEAWHRPGVLEVIVSASRRRNLAVAGLLNLLLLATGVALVRHARSSRQLAQAQMNFVANVSHELRTPLTVIRGAAHNLKRGIVHERTQIEQYSSLIIQHTEQLTDMIEQLLELAGAKKNRPALAREPVELAEALKDAVAAAEPDTRAAGCCVQLEIPSTLPAVAGDAAALRRAFQNLIANAAKHGGEGGWIGVKAGVVNGEGIPMVEVRVADRGPGIPEAEQAEIFKPFVRGALAEAKQIRGSGLGLSLVREILEFHHGTISVNSQPGRGASFIVQIPVTATSQST